MQKKKKKEKYFGKKSEYCELQSYKNKELNYRNKVLTEKLEGVTGYKSWGFLGERRIKWQKRQN